MQLMIGIVLLMSMAAVSFGTGGSSITCNTDFFTPQSNFPSMKLVPKDIRNLSKELSPASPLLLLIRTAEAEHHKHPQYMDLLQRMKLSIDERGICPWDEAQRLQFFDPELTDQGIQQVESLREQLSQSGWSELLENSNMVEYICSPQSRAIQTALLAMPRAQFTVDDGVGERMTPLGPDIRRGYMTPVTVGSSNYHSIQDKFKQYGHRVKFHMAYLGSDKIKDRFGFYRDEDPKIASGRGEPLLEIDQEIVQWLHQLQPPVKKPSRVEKLLDKMIPSESGITLTPKIFVVFADTQFITSVLRHFRLEPYCSQDYRIGFCEIIPIVLKFGPHTPTNPSELQTQSQSTQTFTTATPGGWAQQPQTQSSGFGGQDDRTTPENVAMQSTYQPNRPPDSLDQMNLYNNDDGEGRQQYQMGQQQQQRPGLDSQAQQQQPAGYYGSPSGQYGSAGLDQPDQGAGLDSGYSSKLPEPTGGYGYQMGGRHHHGPAQQQQDQGYDSIGSQFSSSYDQQQQQQQQQQAGGGDYLGSSTQSGGDDMGGSQSNQHSSFLSKILPDYSSK